jgi:hypothetical protein
MTSATEIIEVVARLGLLVVLGTVWGVNGIVLGGVLASLLSKSWWLPRAMAHMLDRPLRQMARLLATGWPVVGVCLTLGGVWLLLVPQATSWVQIIVQSALCGMLLCMMVMVDRSARQLVYAKVRQRWPLVRHTSG